MNEKRMVVADQDARLRRRHPYNEPLPSTMRWAAALPAELRPFALIRTYPRIANLLARNWNDPLECQRYFDELLIDRRGSRLGFPIEVLENLLTLRDYYHGRYPNLPRAGREHEGQHAGVPH